MLKNYNSMKRLFVLIAVLAIAVTANAQSGFGIKGGLNFDSMSDIKTNNYESTIDGRTGFHVGILYKIKLPAGLALQPELLYTSKKSKIETNTNTSYNASLQYLQLPVNIQWGIDLVILRPFIQVSPYIGYAIAKGNKFKDFDWGNFNKFEYGIGLGAGVEIWRFQVSGRYCWDLGKIGDFNKNDVPDQLKNLDKAKHRGFELSLAYMF